MKGYTTAGIKADVSALTIYSETHLLFLLAKVFDKMSCKINSLINWIFSEVSITYLSN